MRPSFLENERRFVLFGGKGGVGKTTSAVACALHFAEQNPNKKILLVSTDPAHSLGDSLDQQIGDRIVAVQGVENLFAQEADAERLLAEFKLTNGPILAKIADRGTYFDKDDVRNFIELSLPGMDEFMAIVELMELAKTRQYDVIVMDTAPTGHTIRLLELPELLQQWVSVLDLMMKKHRFMAETFSRSRYRPDECDRWLETLAGDAKRVRATPARRDRRRIRGCDDSRRNGRGRVRSPGGDSQKAPNPAPESDRQPCRRTERPLSLL